MFRTALVPYCVLINDDFFFFILIYYIHTEMLKEKQQRKFLTLCGNENIVFPINNQFYCASFFFLVTWKRIYILC